jgi:transposase-like protein
MIDVESKELRIAVCRNNSRSAEVMLPWIRKWVKRGSIIRTDCWAAYNKLEEMGYKHEKVNHSETFVTKDGVHSNNIESSWRPLKNFFRDIHLPSVCKQCQEYFNLAKELTKGNEDNGKERKEHYKDIRQARGDCKECEELEVQFGFKIIEYLWRRETKKNGIDPFERLLSAIRHVFERAAANPTIYD